LHLERVDAHVIAVGLARRWARPAVTGVAEIRASLERARRQQALLRIAGAGGERARVRSDVVNHPVPPAAPRGRVRIMHQYRTALGSGWGAAPAELGRDVEIGRAHV